MLPSKMKKIAKGYKITGTNISIRKRPGIKYWQISIYYPENKKSKVISSGTEDFDKAVLYAIEKNAELNYMKKSGVEVFPANFEKVAHSWIQHAEERSKQNHLSVHMLKMLKSVVNVHLIPFFRTQSITSINSDALQRYAEYMVEHKLTSRVTFSNHDIAISKILNYAKDNNWYNRQSIPRIEVPKYAVRETEPRGMFSDREVELIKQGFDKFIDDQKSDADKYNMNLLKAMVLLMLSTGCRTNDIKLLKWGDFRFGFANPDMRGEKVSNDVTKAVSFSLHLLGFSSDKDETYLELCLRGKPSKGKPTERWVPCELSYIEHFIHWRQISQHINDNDLFFAGLNGEFNQNYTSWFSKYLKHLGIPKVQNNLTRTPYSLRHTFITKKLIEGANVFDLALQCGNSVKQIQKTYCHLLPEDLYVKIFKVPPQK